MVNGLWKVIGLCRKGYWVLYSEKGLGFGSGLRERFGFRKGLGLDGFWALIIIVIIIIIIIIIMIIVNLIQIIIIIQTYI